MRSQVSEGSLDALTQTLVDFASEADLNNTLRKLFEKMDLDENQALSFGEFNRGLGFLHFVPPLHISRDDFNLVTAGLLNSDDELSYQGFATLMKLELKAYTSRQALASLQRNRGTPTGDLLFILKMIWSEVEADAAHKLICIFCYRMCSLVIECVSYCRMCSLTTGRRRGRAQTQGPRNHTPHQRDYGAV